MPLHILHCLFAILAMHKTTFVPQLPDSPDLAPADILLFPKQEFKLKGQCFESAENIQENSLAELSAIPQKHACNASKTVKKKTTRGGVLGVNYFEEDKANF
jgi:hypothetical protein